MSKHCCAKRNTDLDKFGALRAFVAVAEHRGFAKASRALNSSPAAMTRTIAALEQQLGAPLFHRSTRSVTLTEEGATLLQRARDLLLQLREAENSVRGHTTEPGGELRITAPVMFGRLHVLPAIADLLSEYPALGAQVLLHDRNVRLVEEGIDAAVRIGDLADSSLLSAPIGSVRQIIVASPAYLERRGVPQTINEITSHDIIGGNHVRVGSHWRFGNAMEKTVSATPRIVINSNDGIIAAAKAGLGLANVLSYQAADAIRTGELRTVLDFEPVPTIPVSILFSRHRASSPAIRLFIQAMRKQTKAAGLL